MDGTIRANISSGLHVAIVSRKHPSGANQLLAAAKQRMIPI